MANTLRFKRGLASGIPTALAGEPLFTTDTFDLYIGNGTTNTRFQKYIASGATTQILRGDGSLYTFPLAISSPSNGQVLKYNGTSWVNDSDSGITGSLTTNYLPKATGATTLGNSLVYDNGTNVGIGTTSPNYKLDLVSSTDASLFQITSTASANNTALRMGIDGNNAFINATGGSSGTLQLRTYGSTRATLDTNGNLGLALTPSAWASDWKAIQVSSFAAFGGDSSDKTTAVSNNYYNDGSAKYIGTGQASLYSQYQGNHRFFVAGSGSANGAITFTQAMTLTALNNLLIGSTSDSGEKLQVTGTAKITGAATFGSTISTNGGYFALRSSAASALGYFLQTKDWIGGGSTDANPALATESSYGLNFYTNGSTTLKMRLDTSGNLGLGVTPSAWGSTWRAIELQYSSGGQAFAGLYPVIIANAHNDGTNYLYKTTAAASYYSQVLGQHRWYNAPSGTANATITFTQAMTLDASGRLGIGIDVPIRTLHVNGGNGVRVAGYGLRNSVQSANSGFIQVGGSDNLYGLLDFNAYDSNTIFEVSNTNPNNNAELRLGGGFVTFRTGSTPTEAARIFSNGNFGINTGATDSGEKLQVNGTAKITGATAINAALTITNATGPSLKVNHTAASHASAWLDTNEFGLLVSSASTSASHYLTNMTSGGTSRFRVNCDGSTTITGASSFGGKITLSLNQNAETNIEISNTTSGTASSSRVSFTSTSSGSIGKMSSGLTTYKTLVASDYFLYNGTAGNISILNDFASGNINFAAGGSSTAQMTLTSGGNLIVDTNTLFVDATNNRVGIGTASPNRTLTANGTVSLLGDNYVGVTKIIQWEGGAYWTLRTTSSGNQFEILRADTLTTHFTISSSNNILINTTTDSGYKFRVNGTSYYDDNARFPNTKGILFENASASAVGSIKMGTGVSNPLEITNGTHTVTLATLGTFISSNLLVGASTIGTSSTNTIAVASGTAPSSSATDIFHLYAADVTAGNAAPHFRTENGAVIKLYQETTAVGNSTISVGGGNSVLDDTEFDGYTLRQIVKALRNQGILA